MIPFGLTQKVTTPKPAKAPKAPKPVKPNLEAVMQAVDMHLGTKQGDQDREAIKAYILSKDPKGTDPERYAREAIAAHEASRSNPLFGTNRLSPGRGVINTPLDVSKDPDPSPRYNAPAPGTVPLGRRRIQIAGQPGEEPTKTGQRILDTQPIMPQSGFSVSTNKPSSLEAEMAAYDATMFGEQTRGTKPASVSSKDWAARQKYRASVAKAHGWSAEGRNTQVARVSKAAEKGKIENLTVDERLAAAGGNPAVSKFLGENPNIGELDDAGLYLNALNQTMQGVSNLYTGITGDPRAMQELPGGLQVGLTLGDIAVQMGLSGLVGGPVTGANTLSKAGQLGARYLAMDAPGYAQMVRDAGGVDKAIIQFGTLIKDSFDPNSRLSPAQRTQGLALGAAILLAGGAKAAQMRGVKERPIPKSEPQITPDQIPAITARQHELMTQGESPADALQMAKEAVVAETPAVAPEKPIQPVQEARPVVKQSLTTETPAKVETPTLRGKDRRAEILAQRQARIEKAASGGEHNASSGLDPTDLKDFYEIAKTYVEDGVDWVKGLKSDVGDDAEQYIPHIQKALDEGKLEPTKPSDPATPIKNFERDLATWTLSSNDKEISHFSKGRVVVGTKGEGKQFIIVNTPDGLTFSDVPGQFDRRILTEAHEIMHGYFNAAPERGHIALKSLEKYYNGETPGNGMFEALIELGRTYGISKEWLKQAHPELYKIANDWLGDSPITSISDANARLAEESVRQRGQNGGNVVGGENQSRVLDAQRKANTGNSKPKVTEPGATIADGTSSAGKSGMALTDRGTAGGEPLAPGFASTPIKPPKPPKDASATLETPGKGEYQGFTHADVKSAMEELGNPTRKRNPKSDKTLAEEAQQLHPKAEQIANDYDASRPLSDAEQLAVGAKFSEVLNQYKDLKLKLLEAGEAIEGNPALNDLNQRLIKLAKANDGAGTEAGRSLRARRFLIEAGGDIDLTDIDAVLFKASHERGVAIDDLKPEFVKDLTDKVDALKKENDALKAKQVALDEAKAAVAVARTRSRIGGEGRTVEVVRAEKKLAITRLRDAIAKSMSGVAGAGGGAFEAIIRNAPEVGRALRDIIKLHIEEAKITRLDAKFYNDIREQVGEITDADGNKIELTDSDIRSTWAGFYDETSGTKAGAEATVAKLRRQAGLIEKIERAREGLPQPEKQRAVKDPEIKRLQNQLRELLSTVDNEAARERIKETIRKLEAQKASGARDPGVKPKQATNQDLHEIVQSLRKDLRLQDKIADLTKQLETGEYKGPDVRVEKLTAEQKAQQAKIKHLQNKVRAGLRMQEPITLTSIIKRFVYTNVMSNPEARIGDLSGNSANAVVFALEKGVRVPFQVILEAMFKQSGGREIPFKNYLDVADGFGAEVKQRVKETLAGTSEESLKFEQSAFASRAAGVTDAPFNVAYQRDMLYELATHEAKKQLGKGATSEAIAARRKVILADPPEGMAAASMEWALRQTYNVENYLSYIEKAFAGGPAALGKALDKKSGSGKHTAENVGKFVGLFTGAPFRFTRVIGNVAMQAVDHTPVGIVQALTRTEVMRRQGYSVSEMRLISDLMARGLVGSAAIALGFYVKQSGNEPDLIKTEGGTIFMETSWFDKTAPGLWRVFMMGKGLRALENAEKAGNITKDQAAKARYALWIGLATDQPLTGGMERIARATEGGGKTIEKFATGVAVSNLLPGSAASRFTAKVWDSIERDIKAGRPISLGSALQEKRVESKGWADEISKAVPVMRGRLMLSPDKRVNAPGEPTLRYPEAQATIDKKKAEEKAKEDAKPAGRTNGGRTNGGRTNGGRLR